MLHIILGILKWIGILLGALILLILLNAAILLLVPIRYQIQLVKTENAMNGQVRLTWLLHLISARFSYDVRHQERQMEIRILGISLEKFKSIRSRRREKKRQKQRAKLQKELKKEQSQNTLQPVRSKKENMCLEANKEERKLPQEVCSEDQERLGSKTDTEEGNITAEKEVIHESAVKTNLYEAAEEVAGKESEAERAAAERTVIHEFWTKLAGSCERIKTIPMKLKAVIERIVRLTSSAVRLIGGICSGIVRFWEKINNIPDQIEMILEGLEEYEVKAVTGDVKQELNYIWKHYGLRWAEGFLHFGTGDPAVTGQLTGLLYMLLPAIAGAVEIQPEFAEQILETELTAKGYVRSCHMIPVGWRLLKNKRLIRLIKKIRTFH